MLLELKPSLKVTIDKLYSSKESLDCKSLRTEISDDETLYEEYDDIQEYRMIYGCFPGRNGDGYYTYGTRVYHDDLHIDECVANAICEWYNKQDGISKNFEEFLGYLCKREMLLNYFSNVVEITERKEIPFKYVNNKFEIGKNVRLNRPRVFQINNEDMYLIQPDRRRHEFISLSNNVKLPDSRIWIK